MKRPFAAYEGDEPYVFVCYAHADKGLVYPEITRLNDSGWHIWYDEGIEPGSEWSDSIATHVERCALFLYFVTPRSVQTEHCRREINFAIDQSRRVLAVHLLPTELPSGLKLTLSNRQAILKYDEPRSAYEVKLVGAIGDARSHHVSGTAPTAIQPITPRGWRPAWAAGTASALVVMAAGVGIWFTRQPMRDMRPLDRSLAVMPFSVIGGGADATTTYAEALTEDLRNVVTDYHELRSVAVENATNVARGTSYLADGNVQRLADGIRVRASLTRTVDHQTIWAQTFERPLTEGTADPTQLASTIGRFVRQNLVQDERCESVRRTARSEEAAAAYCAALAENQRLTLVGGHDLQLELSDEQRAIALDPALSDAYRILASNYYRQGSYGVMDWQIASRLAHSALDRGFALAPNDPRLLTVQGLVLGLLDLDRQGGEASLRASLASDPLDPAAYRNYQGLGSLALARGDLGEAVDNYRRALRIYDADASIYWFLGAALLFSGENDEAIRVADAGLQLIDEGGGARANLLSVKVSAYSALGQTAQASAALDGAVASVGPEWQPALILPFASAGRMVEAKQLFAQLEATKHPPLEFLVEVVAAADFDRERTFALIHEAINRHISLVANTLRSNTVYAQLRKDPRWAEVMTHLEAEEAKGSDGQNRASPSA